MKVCPKCGQSFNDDNLRFCLLDGEQLVNSQSEPTVVIPPTENVDRTAIQPNKKGKKWLWALLTLAVLAIGLGVVATVAIVAYKIGSERSHIGASNAAASPTPTARAVSTPAVQTTTSPTPSAVASPSPAGDTNNDEVTPIAWTTTAGQFKQDPGQTYTFECPKGGTAGTIWGSDVYTADSSICTAAVHMGKITLQDGGTVTIEMRPGRAIYGSTVRNGITSNTFGEFQHSFVIK